MEELRDNNSEIKVKYLILAVRLQCVESINTAYQGNKKCPFCDVLKSCQYSFKSQASLAHIGPIKLCETSKLKRLAPSVCDAIHFPQQRVVYALAAAAKVYDVVVSWCRSLKVVAPSVGAFSSLSCVLSHQKWCFWYSESTIHY